MQSEPVETILVIDDEARLRRVITRVLESEGYGVRQAEDGLLGLQAFRATRPDAVLLDLRMPGLGGLEVLAAMVAEGPEVPVVVVSGESTRDDAVAALKMGAWDFVSKPFEGSLLSQTLQGSLERARLRRENQHNREELVRVNLALGEALRQRDAEQQRAFVLQFQLLPKDNLELGSYVATRRLFPSRILSGDFVDYFQLGTRHAGFYLADVAGHGAPSALVTAILATMVHRHREAVDLYGDQTALDPGALLARLDQDIQALGLGTHVTLFYGVLDFDRERLVYANAGQFPFPEILHQGQVTTLECPGRPLGLPGKAGVARGEIPFSPRHCLLLCSDGALELGAPGSSSRDRRQALRDQLRRTANIDSIARVLGLDGDTRGLKDDVALLLIRGKASV